MLKTRTKVLFAASLLAPASMVISRLTVAAEQRRLLQQGAWAAWVDPAPVFPALFLVGCLSFVVAIVFVIVDIRQRRL